MRSGSKPRAGSRERGKAFTLIEIMMVVAIFGLIAAMGIPAILSVWHQEPLRKAVNDVTEICYRARAQAILHGEITSVVFYPQARQVSGSGDSSAPSTRPGTAPVTSAQFDDGVSIEALGINGVDCTGSEEASVRFFPNGTSDEMTLLLSDGGAYTKISTEVTTGLASVENIK